MQFIDRFYELLEDTKKNNDKDVQLIAFLVSAAKLTPRDLKQFLQDKLPEYMIPNIFAFVDKIPLNHNGKTDRKALLAKKLNIDPDATILDLGSRDAKWVRFVDGKFKDLDWNTACASSTGATIEMLMKFYNLKPENLSAAEEKYSITCGIFGLERIMDDIARGESSAAAVSKFIHGIAFNTWNFARRAEKRGRHSRRHKILQKRRIQKSP